MATKSITIRVNNVAAVRQHYDKIQVFKTSTVLADGTPDDSTYVEVTTADTRLALVEASEAYVFIDPNGLASEFYAIRYYNSRTGDQSGFSGYQMGVSDPALELFPVDTLKSVYLFGLDLTNDEGEPYPDALFQFYIRQAVQFVQDKLDIDLLPKEYVDEAHDFHKRDYNAYVWTKLDHVPVIEVTRARLVLPTEAQVVDFAASSFQVDKNAGHLEIVPGSGQITLGQTGAFLPLVFGGQDYLPRALRVTYKAGFLNGNVPMDIVHAIGMLASFGPLNTAGDLIVGAGIASTSLSIDGLSQSVNTTSSATNSGYGARIIQYQKELKDLWPTLRRRYHPVNMVVA